MQVNQLSQSVSQLFFPLNGLRRIHDAQRPEFSELAQRVSDLQDSVSISPDAIEAARAAEANQRNPEGEESSHVEDEGSTSDSARQASAEEPVSELGASARDDDAIEGRFGTDSLTPTGPDAHQAAGGLFGFAQSSATQASGARLDVLA